MMGHGDHIRSEGCTDMKFSELLQTSNLLQLLSGQGTHIICNNHHSFLTETLPDFTFGYIGLNDKWRSLFGIDFDGIGHNTPCIISDENGSHEIMDCWTRL